VPRANPLYDPRIETHDPPPSARPTRGDERKPQVTTAGIARLVERGDVRALAELAHSLADVNAKLAAEIEDERMAEATLRKHLERTRRQQEALLMLAAATELPWYERLRAVIKVDSETIDVARVSYWQLAREGQSIRCDALFRADRGGFEHGLELFAKDFPGYFHALHTGAVIVAADANTDPSTREFSESYLEPAGIGAMMDVPVYVRGVFTGVVCHEHVGGTRPWSGDEQQFALSIGQVLSLALESEDRRRAEQALRESEARFRHAALHDALTGLPNRLVLFDILRREIGRAKRDASYRFAVLYFDLDGFKAVNDTLGHDAGDRLLMTVGERLNASMRPMDAVARVGGDEFAVVVANVAEREAAAAIAQRIAAAVSAPLRIGDREVEVGASVGIAMADGSSDPSGLLRAADLAMYEQKTARRAGA
jgi:diguanylate cyclase (GGDEF)-like protein